MNLTNTAIEILIVEDSPTQVQQLQHILEQQGYQVASAANGRLALEAAHRRKPTLIISDVVMPEMDGYELCRRIKSDASLSEIPIILERVESTNVPGATPTTQACFRGDASFAAAYAPLVVRFQGAKLVGAGDMAERDQAVPPTDAPRSLRPAEGDGRAARHGRCD